MWQLSFRWCWSTLVVNTFTCFNPKLRYGDLHAISSKPEPALQTHDTKQGLQSKNNEKWELQSCFEWTQPVMSPTARQYLTGALLRTNPIAITCEGKKYTAIFPSSRVIQRPKTFENVLFGSLFQHVVTMAASGFSFTKKKIWKTARLFLLCASSCTACSKLAELPFAIMSWNLWPRGVVWAAVRKPWEPLGFWPTNDCSSVEFKSSLVATAEEAIENQVSLRRRNRFQQENFLHDPLQTNPKICSICMHFWSSLYFAKILKLLHSILSIMWSCEMLLFSWRWNRHESLSNISEERRMMPSIWKVTTGTWASLIMESKSWRQFSGHKMWPKLNVTHWLIHDCKGQMSSTEVKVRAQGQHLFHGALFSCQVFWWVRVRVEIASNSTVSWPNLESSNFETRKASHRDGNKYTVHHTPATRINHFVFIILRPPYILAKASNCL